MKKLSVCLGASLLGLAIAGCGSGLWPPSSPLPSSSDLSHTIHVGAPEVQNRDAVTPEGSDLDLLQRAIDKAVDSSEPTEIILEPRTYHLSCVEGNNAYCLSIRGGRQLVLRGVAGRTKLLITTPRAGVLAALNVNGLELRDFTVDYETPPFTQGTIIAVQDSAFHLRVDPGFPSPSGSLFANDAFYQSNGLYPSAIFGSIFEPTVPRLTDGRPDAIFIGRRPTQISSDTWHISTPHTGLRGLMVPGERFAFAAPWGYSGFAFGRATDITLRNVTIYASQGCATTFAGVEGTILIEHLTIRRRPDSSRLLSSNCDAVHVQNSRARLVVRDSYIEGMNDDSINTYGTGVLVLSSVDLGEDQVRLQIPSFSTRVGDKVQVLAHTRDVFRIGVESEPAVTAIRHEPDAIVLTLDHSADIIQPGDILFNSSASSPGAAIVGNTFGYLRGRFRLRGPNTVFARNHILDRKNAVVLTSIDNSWTLSVEGPESSIVFCQNRVADRFGGPGVYGIDWRLQINAPFHYHYYMPPAGLSPLLVPQGHYQNRRRPTLAWQTHTNASNQWCATGVNQGLEDHSYP
jgi:hypothetical protein